LPAAAAADQQAPALALDGGEQLEYGGLCSSCGQQHYLRPTAAALQAAAALVQRLDGAGRIDFDADAADPRFSTDYVWTKGPGRMFGVLECSDSQVGPHACAGAACFSASSRGGGGGEG
jgi:hypothetical protein